MVYHDILSYNRIRLPEVLKEQIDEIRTRHNVEFAGEDICEVCGARPSARGSDRRVGPDAEFNLAYEAAAHLAAWAACPAR